MKKRTDNPTIEEIKEFRDRVFSRLYNGKLLTSDEIKKILEGFYKLILKKDFPNIVIIKNSPMEAWSWIQENKCENKKENYINPNGICFEDAGYYSYLTFLEEKKFMILNEDLKRKLELANKMLDIFKVWAIGDCVVVSQKPISIKMVNDRLHNPHGPSIEFADGFCIYSLNGINVPEYVIKKDTFTKEEILNEKNADVRREIVRKIGNEKLVEVLGGDIVDSKDGYELILIDIGDDRKRPFLKMINPSIGCTHVEGVHPDCKTVEDALKFRNGVTGSPVVLS